MLEFGMFGGLYVRRFKFYRSQTMPGHTHNYDHASQIMRGTFLFSLTVNGEVVERTIKAPGIIHVPAEAFHEMRCLTEEGEVWCTFPARDPTGEITAHLDEVSKNEKIPYWTT